MAQAPSKAVAKADKKVRKFKESERMFRQD
jgi:hypothetical protein